MYLSFSGDWSFDEQCMNVCAEDYAQGKSYSFDADTLSPEKQIYAKLFPNPNDGESVMLAYDFLSDEQFNIQIFEVTGKIALELSNLKGGMNEKHLELSNLEKGMYLVNVFTASERQTICLVIH
jgi:hypothetical protein